MSLGVGQCCILLHPQTTVDRSRKVMNDGTMVSTVSSSITCPFLTPRHLSVSHVTVKQFCREERRFQYRYDWLFCEVRRPGYASIIFSRTSRRLFILFFCWEKYMGDKIRKIILKSAKRRSNDPQFEGKGLATLSWVCGSWRLRTQNRNRNRGCEGWSLIPTISDFFFFSYHVQLFLTGV